jgi:putative FmdB family regulatory protein
MPIHQYECEACGNVFDEFKTELQNQATCPRCGCASKISFNWGCSSNSIQVFKPFVNDMLDFQDIEITSRSQLKHEADKRGLNVRGLSDGYIDWNRTTKRRTQE